MFRRFGTETLRLIENKAIEIDKLAREIDEIDSNDEVSSTAYRLRSIHQEGFDSDLKVKLEDYEIKINNYCSSPEYVENVLRPVLMDSQMTWF